MRAALLWPGDKDIDPPRPTFIGTDAGQVVASDPDLNTAWLSEWGALYTVLTAMGRVQLLYLPDTPMFDVQEYSVQDTNNHRWLVRAVYVAVAATWYVRGEPQRIDP